MKIDFWTGVNHSVSKIHFHSARFDTSMPQLTWLITGCSSRFGEQFVPSILARGDRVIITARGDIKRLSHWESSGAKALVLDVTASQTKLNEIIQQAISLFDGIDVLVNNAGYVESGLVEEARFVFETARNLQRGSTEKRCYIVPNDFLPSFKPTTLELSTSVGPCCLTFEKRKLEQSFSSGL